MGDKRASRADRRDRAVARVKVPVPTTLRAFDPLVRPTGSKAAQLLRTALVLLAAVGLHAFMLSAIFAANRVAASLEPDVQPVEKIEIAIVEPPPPPPVEPPPPPPAVEEEPEPESAPPPPKKKPKPKKEPEPPPKALPPDPIDLPPDPPEEPPKEPPKKQPRRIVGLNLESTVAGSNGPAFATGNTRMGRTGDVAEDAKKVEKLDNAPSQPRVNRKATRVPGRGRGKVVQPKRRGRQVKPTFPPLLKQQEIEADVTVEVRIDEAGRVASARVVDGPRFEEFRDAALEAARKQRWAPATQGGKPIPYTLTYTYRFRITD